MNSSDLSQPPAIGRRHLLQTLLATAALGGYGRAEETPASKEIPADLTLAAASMGLITTNVSSVKPETTEGPYYLDPKLVRSDIKEGKQGIPLRMQLQVITADCRPVKGARVDLWHCDALGNYSGYSDQGSDSESDTTGKTFLRGTQPTDAQGVVTFETIYPGWYRGRTTHFHYKVFLDEKTVLTSQIFFPDALSEYIYEKSPAYKRTGTRDTLNSVDGIAAQAGEGAYASIREQKDRYIAALVVCVDPNATSSEKGKGMPGGKPPGANGQRPQGPPPGGKPPGGGPGGPSHTQRDETTRIFPGG
ncbi:MAG: intradiol ring-cleavage dioxygenase [Luteolibacter sp.]